MQIYNCTNTYKYEVGTVRDRGEACTKKYTNTYKNTNIQIYKYTNIQIYKYTNIRLYKYTNKQIYKTTNTQLQI